MKTLILSCASHSGHFMQIGHLLQSVSVGMNEKPCAKQSEPQIVHEVANVMARVANVIARVTRSIHTTETCCESQQCCPLSKDSNHVKGGAGVAEDHLHDGHSQRGHCMPVCALHLACLKNSAGALHPHPTRCRYQATGASGGLQTTAM